MDIRIVSKASFKVIGKVGQGPSNLGPQWIGRLWDEANSKFSEISQLVKYDKGGKAAGIWGAMSDVDEQFKPWGAEGKYLAGCEAVDETIAPPGWTTWQIPSYKYVAASCTQENYDEVFNFVLKSYFTDNGYKLVGAVHEHYPQDAEKGTIHLYFPIEMK